METPEAATWDQVVSQSQAKLSNKTPSAGPRKLLVRPQAEPRHLLAIQREPAMIDQRLRDVIRKAAAGAVKWPLFVVGKPGSGKTCAGLCVADHVEGSGFWPWDEFWRFLNDVNMGRAVTQVPGKKNPNGYTEPGHSITWTSARWWAAFRSLPVAIVDDIGLRASANDTQYEAMKRALDEREGLPLILMSNLDEAGIGTIFDLRVMDRISCGTVVKLEGKSLR